MIDSSVALREQTIRPTLAGEALKASAQRVTEHAQREYKGDITMRSIAPTTLAAGEMKNEEFAGWMVKLERSYGPRRYLGDKRDSIPPVPHTNVLQDNEIEVQCGMLCRDQNKDFILSERDNTCCRLASGHVDNEANRSSIYSDSNPGSY